MMKYIYIGFLLIASFVFMGIADDGCDNLTSTNKPAQAAPKPRREHHFEPVQHTQGSLAIDTTTGQMCRTWAWVCVKYKYNPKTGKTEEETSNEGAIYGVDCASIATMPTCESISNADK